MIYAVEKLRTESGITTASQITINGQIMCSESDAQRLVELANEALETRKLKAEAPVLKPLNAQLDAFTLKNWVEQVKKLTDIVDVQSERLDEADVLTIAGGKSPRGNPRGHAVVMVGAGPEVHHDPHPSRAGIVGEPEDWMWFEPIGGGS